MGSRREDEDRALFRQAMRGVRPLPDTGTAQAPGRGPRPQARFTRAGRREVLDEVVRGRPGTAPAAEGSFSRPGVAASTLRRLRRGEPRIQAELDLHGLNLAQAQEALREFLLDAHTRQLRCLRIIHGKGLRSGERGPVLRGWVRAALARPDRVVAFVPAPAADGGSGAVHVLLRG
ncbi:MAG TPA: Smr/MutS family protein [Steroidobacteraceae bacterium]|nr:Smr/MutS family protein [Steroidobacteraceae bacterium]